MTGVGPDMAVHVLHENPDWLPPFVSAFADEGVELVEMMLAEGTLDLSEAPPRGVFWSRMSASSHTRGHPYAKDYTRAVLSWLEAHGRRVVNGRRVLELEMSKADQTTALAAAGIDVPRTLAVVGTGGLLAAAQRFEAPFISKHNQGGKGLGVRRHDGLDAFTAAVAAPDWEPPVDGITLLQEYVEPAEPFVTRVEVVGGRFFYALAADTRQGFELCPADACAVDEPLFHLRKDFLDLPFAPALVASYLDFAGHWGIEIAGFEFLETADGRLVTYDVNTNTNYNPGVEAQAERSGPREIARFLGALAGQA